MKNNNISTFIKNPCNQYIIIWLLYTLQGTGYYDLGLFSVALHLFLITYTVYYFIIAKKNYKLPSFLKACFLFVGVIIVYTIFRVVDGSKIVDGVGFELIPTSTLRSFYPILSIFVFYVFTKRGSLTKKSLRNWVFVFTGAAILSIYGLRVAFINRLGSADVGSFTNNAGYYVLSIMPAIYLFKKRPLVQYVLLLILMYYIITSVKRGTIILGVLCFCTFLYNSYKTKNTSRPIMFIFSIIALFAMYSLFNYELNTNDYLISRFQSTQDGDLSERNDIYSFMIDIYQNRSGLFHQIFGYGLDGTIKLNKIMAHSDWIEFLINMGLVGVSCLVYFFYSIYSSWRSMKHNQEIYFMFGMSALILFIKSFYSMSITGLTVYAACILGYCLAVGENYHSCNAKPSNYE